MLLVGGASTHASVGDCLKAAYQAVNPKDLERAAQFASQHPTCLTNLVPPYVVPYAALSGSLDAANQSGALNQVGLGFGNNYGQCVAKLDPGKAALKQLAPVLKPVCGTLNMNCNAFESEAASQVNSHLTEQFPLLGMMPCACAAATSGLGVEKIAETLKTARQCGATLAEVGKVVGNAANGVYDTGSKAVDATSDAANKAAESMGKLISTASGALGTAYCAVAGIVGGCDTSPPPTGLTVATSWCKPRAGLKAYQSVSNLPNDFSLICGDGTQCVVRPNQPVRCQTPEMKAASQAAKAKQDAATVQTNKTWCTQRTTALKTGYDALCRDSSCKGGVFLVAADFSAKCLKNSDAAEGFSPYPAELWAVNGETPLIALFEKLIKESIQRDPKASVNESMNAWACRSFLGRPDERLCPSKPGFDACVKLVQSGQLKACRLVGSQEVYNRADVVKLQVQPRLLSLPSLHTPTSSTTRVRQVPDGLAVPR
jgi:hypothetical protein